jgi:hypothetical protein
MKVIHCLMGCKLTVIPVEYVQLILLHMPYFTMIYGGPEPVGFSKSSGSMSL